MGRKRSRRALFHAQRASDVLRITRRRRWDGLRGVVPLRGKKWILLALDQDAGVNGYVACAGAMCDELSFQSRLGS